MNSKNTIIRGQIISIDKFNRIIVKECDTLDVKKINVNKQHYLIEAKDNIGSLCIFNTTMKRYKFDGKEGYTFILRNFEVIERVCSNLDII